MSSKVNQSNYTSLLVTEKGAYYQGEIFDGSVILGRKGGAQNPNGVALSLDGKELSDEDYELIDYIRYTSVFTQPSLVKDLKRPSKPPLLTNLCQICRKIGSEMPEHFKKVIDWSIRMSEHNTRWDGHLICAEALNVDNIPISPSHGTSLFDVLVVHKELFLGFD